MEFGLVVVWLVTYLALLAAGQAIGRVVLGDLADEGAGVGVSIAAGLVLLVAYYVGRVSITAGLWLGVGTLVVAALAAYTVVGPIDRRAYVQTAAVFTIAFLFMVGIRAIDPAVHAGGGEKFLDFGMLRSLLRGSVIPPEDVWFAGETVRYYFGGHYLAALLARLTGTAPRYAYNLALAGFYAMLVTAAFGLGRSIAAARGHRPVLAGGLSAFFVGFASNLLPAAQLVVLALPAAPTGWLESTLGVSFEGSLATSLSAFGYWDASRVIEGIINEFPLFSWLNGDMHGHMMSMPFMLLGATLLLGYYRSPAGEVWRRRAILFGGVPPVAAILSITNTWSFPTLCGLAAVTVVLAPTDPIDLVPGRFRPAADGRVMREGGRLGVALGAAATIAGLAVVLVLPYWVNVSSGSEGIGLFPDRSTLGPLLIVHGAFLAIAAIHYSRYATGTTVRVGATRDSVTVARGVNRHLPESIERRLVTVSERVIRHLARPIERLRSETRLGDLIAWIDDRIGASFIIAVAMHALIGIAIVALTHLGVPALGLFGPLILVIWVVHRLGDTHGLPTPGFESVLIVTAAVLIVAVEFAYLENQGHPGRYNTGFKIYAQIWILFATGAAAALVAVLDDHRPELSWSGERARKGFTVLAVLIVLSTSIYGAFAVSNHVTSNRLIHQADDPTLDGLRFVEQTHADEAAAIAWLDANVDGQPTLLERPGQLYQWSSPASSLTGIPTVVGWSHANNFHDNDEYDRRVADVETMFTGPPDRQRDLLRQYDVAYVYVGPLERERYSTTKTQALNPVEYVYIGPHERERYSTITIQDLDAVEPVKRFDEVTIYRVDRDALYSRYCATVS